MREGLVRSFVAFEIPLEMRRRIGQLCDSMRGRPGAESLRFVHPEILHMTVRFFGDLDRKRLDRARRAIQSIDLAWDPPDLTLGEIGAFPSRKRPQVVWLGVNDPDGTHRRLAEETDRAIRISGFGPADKPFVAHLTRARVARGRPGPELDALTAGLTAPPGPLRITTITLFQSVLRGGLGPEYTPLEVARPRGTAESPMHGERPNDEPLPRARRTGQVQQGSQEGDPADG